MVIGNIKHVQDYGMLEEQVAACIEWAKKHNLRELSAGTHEIDGERMFVNIVEYETTTPENRFWEAHRHYLDVHLILCGTEQIDLNFIKNMDLKDFQEENDFLPMEGEKKVSVVLEEGDYLVCYPGDGHRTGVAVKESVKLKKAIFKVQIQNRE